MAAYTYTKINWENEPSYNTPINETNLNHMDQGIFDLAYVKAEKNDAVFVNSISLDRKAGTSVGLDSVAAGYDTEASGVSSVAIGSNTSAKNGQAVAGGFNSKAWGNTSLAFGTNCITRFNAAESQAIGNNCIAGSANQMVFGQYNVEDTTGTYAEIVGNGSSGNESNARTLDWQGNETIAGDFTNGNGETLHGIYEALPVDSESGNPAVITDAFGGACKSLKLTLEPIQSGSGTPSPQNVRPISGRTSSIINRSKGNIDVIVANGAFSGKGSDYSEATRCRSTFISVDEGKTYRFTVKSTNVSKTAQLYVFWCISNVPDEYDLVAAGSWGNELEYTCPSGYHYVRVLYRYSDNSNVTNVNFSDAHIFETPFETITRTYGTTIYGGSDDVTGEGAVNKLVMLDASTLTWTLITNNRWNAGVISGIKPVLNSEASSIMSDRYETMSADNLYSQTSQIGIAQNVSGELLIRNGSTTTPPTGQILYELATPTSIPLTAQNITLLHGDNVLTTDADSIEASYSADIALYIDKKIAEGSQGNRSLSKGGSGDEESKEEVKEEEKKEEIEIKEAEPLTKEVR